MKKILSALISIMLLFGAASVTPIMAAELGNYTYIDTCYSPELGLYVAVAKDFSNYNNTKASPAKIYISNNMIDWQETRQFSNATHNASPYNRQTIVWWAEEQVFVFTANTTTYISRDGIEWTTAPNTLMSGSNTILETNGKQLVVVSGASVKRFDSLDDDSYEILKIDSGAYGKTVGMTPEAPMSYYVTDQWKTWKFEADGTAKSAVPNLLAMPLDMAYVKGFNGWVVANNTAALRVLDNTESVKYVNFEGMQLSDGTTNTDKFTAVGVNDDNVVMGTATGKILVAPNDKAAATVEVQWEIASSGNNSVSDEEITSISAVDNGNFLVASQTKLYILTKENGVWRFYDVGNDDIAINETRFEIPVSGMYSEVIEPIHYDYRGEVSSDKVVSFEPVSKIPDGIMSEGIDGSSAAIVVNSSASGGHEIIYRAITQSGKVKDFTITIVDEDHMEITGSDKIAIPLTSGIQEEHQYKIAVIGTDGQEMERTAVLEVISKPEGAIFDSDSNTFIIDVNTEEGEIELAAYSAANPSNRLEKRIEVADRRPERIELTEASDSLFIPDNSEEVFTYSAVLYDQIDREIEGEKIDWSIEGKEIDSMDGISINEDTGELTVANTAVKGVVTIKATAKRNPDINSEIDVTLNYTDLRIVQEDFSEFELDTSKPITDNLTLVTECTLGSTVKWRSADESIISTDGIVTRPSREDKKVTITGVWKKDSASFEQKYELIVKKADNLCTNGDLTDGTTEGWTPKGETELSVVQDNGKNVLSVQGTGAYQTLIFTNDSSYGFEARVKAPSGSKVRIVSEKGGTLAEITASGGYQDIKASYDYRKQKDTFEDKIYIEYSGSLMIEKLVVYEITLELNEVSAAVNKAVYSKTQEDINTAGTLLAQFYDLPVRSELYKKLNAVNAGGSTSGGGIGSSGVGGGGSSSGGSSKNDTAPSSVITDKTESNIPAFENVVDDNTSDELDTYLLRFKDMKNHWARNDVEYMAEIGIVNGDTNDTFRPDDKVSRAEFAAMISRAMGLEETEYENSFFDVVKDDWYSGYVQTVRSNNYMNGYDGLFNPSSAITREEIAKVIVSAYNSKTNTKLQTGLALYFNDIDDISGWAYDYIVEAADMGFIYGVTDELFAPKQLATRAEATVMLKRVYVKLNQPE